jgi:hypothetical protein
LETSKQFSRQPGSNKPVNAKLPSYFPSDLDIELAQYFAEDIWFYREDDQRVYAIGVNYLDQTLNDYDLQLPTGFLKDAA